MKSSLVVPSTVQKKYKQIFGFAVSKWLAAENIGFGKHDQLVLLSQAYKTVRYLSNFCGNSQGWEMTRPSLESMTS